MAGLPLRALGSVVLLASVLVLGVPAGSALASEVKTKAPNFRSTDMNGEKVELEDLLGKGPIIVDFWATWCKPCIKELPFIQKMYDEYAEQGLEVLAVTIDSPRSQAQVKPFVKGRGYTFPVVMDGSQDVFRQLQGKGSIPYVVVIDSEGFIRYRHTGYRPGDEKELEEVVVGLLKGSGADDEAAAEEEAAVEDATG